MAYTVPLVLPARSFSKFSKPTLDRPIRTRPRRNSPKIGRNQPTTSQRPEKDGNGLKKSDGFFFSGHHVELDSSGLATAPARGAKTLRDVPERKNWRPDKDISSQNAAYPGFGSSNSSHISYSYGSLCDNERLNRNGTAQEASQKPPDSLANPPYAAKSFTVGQGHRYGELTEEEIHEELQRTSTAGDFPQIQEILKILIHDRGEKPSRKHYQALLLMSISPRNGSAADAVRVMLQMEEAGITLDSAAYHAVLKVLAIHPDYLLRRCILEELRQRWFTLSSEGWHDLTVGLLRDKQIESAIAVLQSAQQVEIQIEPWLYDMLIYNLCDVDEFDEVLSILRFRVDNGEQLISGTVWYYFLDSASSAFHHSATLFAWRKRVESGYLNPSSGICLNVINTAARHGDFQLAVDVVRVLGNRNEALQLYHYEALVESFLPSDLRTSLMLLTLMTSRGMSPTDCSTRPILFYLRQSSNLPSIALSILRGLYEQDRPVPIEAANVIIESYVEHGNFDAALETYKTLHKLCLSGPTCNTFNRLLRGCRGRKDAAMFLASEMVALEITPDALTYDLLMLVCMESSLEDDMDDAWRYFEEMREAGWWPRPATVLAMAKCCCQMGDERIWQLQGNPEECQGIERSVLENMVAEGWMKGNGIQKTSKILDALDAEDPWA
ncbi:MAG: hypothetical protein Q9207_001920 [Kuettlingeria erythrocarpa]